MKEQVNEGKIDGLAVQKISFPWGIPGLNYEEYLLCLPAENSPFFILQSEKDPEVGLILVDPFEAFSDYEFELNDDVADQLEIEDQSQLAVLCTVNTSRGLDNATVNLLAPIVINTSGLKGKQVVLNEKKYSLRTPLAIKRAEKEKGR